MIRNLMGRAPKTCGVESGDSTESHSAIAGGEDIELDPARDQVGHLGPRLLVRRDALIVDNLGVWKDALDTVHEALHPVFALLSTWCPNPGDLGIPELRMRLDEGRGVLARTDVGLGPIDAGRRVFH